MSYYIRLSQLKILVKGYHVQDFSAKVQQIVFYIKCKTAIRILQYKKAFLYPVNVVGLYQ